MLHYVSYKERKQLGKERQQRKKCEIFSILLFPSMERKKNSKTFFVKDKKYKFEKIFFGFSKIGFEFLSVWNLVHLFLTVFPPKETVEKCSWKFFLLLFVSFSSRKHALRLIQRVLHVNETNIYAITLFNLDNNFFWAESRYCYASLSYA